MAYTYYSTFSTASLHYRNITKYNKKFEFEFSRRKIGFIPEHQMPAPDDYIKENALYNHTLGHIFDM